MPDIIGQLQQFRREHGLTQEQVARTLGVSVVTVNRWESRRSAPSARSAGRISQLISHRRHPALPSAGRHLAPLSADRAPFTGRSRELGRLLAIWPHQRLLTLTGPGGIGKSRLAAELLRRAGQLPLASVGLDLVPDPVLALAEIAAVLGLPVPPGPRAETLIGAALQEAEGVLFLDRCEHVASGLRGLLGALVSRAPSLRVLATSQVPLQVPGERVWPVPGLDCLPAEAGPNPGAAAHRELARTGRAGPAHRRHALFVRELGRRAEASHFRVDRGNWPERLGRAVGDIQSALHWACGADPALGAEIATSLLGWWRSSGRIAGGRHWLRACRERAGGLPEAWLARASVAEALLAVDQGEYGEADRLAESAWPALEAAGDAQWLSRALIARSAVAASHGQTAVARQYLSRAVDYQAGRGDLHEMAVSLDSLGRLEADAGYLRRARGSYQRGLTVARELDDDRLTATALANLAAIATLGKRFGQARLLLEEAMPLADRVADDHVRAVIALGLAENLLGVKDYPAAIARFRAARDYASASGDGRLSALAICGLGRALYAHGHEIDGRNLLLLGERLAMQTGDHLVLGKARDALRAVTRIATGPKLTKRETEVIRLVDKGESDRVIAGHLGIAVPTVRRHLENIFAKLNTRSRGAAAAIWRNLP